MRCHSGSAAFGHRLLTELNYVAGLGAVGGLALAGASFFSQGATRYILIAIGLAISLPTIVVSTIRAIPPKVLTPAEVEGRELTLEELAQVEPP
jgi:hypothetical protein